MRKILLLTTVSLTLMSCSRLAESRINPLNWFGSARSEPAAAAELGPLRPLVPERLQRAIIDQRPLVEQITALSVDRTPDGAIIRATGLTAAQGYYNAQLVRLTFQDGVLTYGMRAQAPTGFSATGSDASRQITVAHVISNQDLANIRSIRVQSATNAQTVRR